MRAPKPVDVTVTVATIDRPQRFGVEKFLSIEAKDAAGALVAEFKLSLDDWTKSKQASAGGVMTLHATRKRRKAVSGTALASPQPGSVTAVANKSA